MYIRSGYCGLCFSALANMDARLEFALGAAGRSDDSNDGDTPGECGGQAGEPEPQEVPMEVDGGTESSERACSGVFWAIVPWRPLPARRSDVSRDEQAELSMAPLNMHALAPLRRVFDHVIALSEAPGAALDVDSLRLSNEFLPAVGGPIMKSKTAIAQSLGLSRKEIEPKLGRLACALVHADRCMVQAFAEALRAHVGALSLFCEYCRYDATTMRVTVRPGAGGAAHPSPEQAPMLGGRPGPSGSDSLRPNTEGDLPGKVSESSSFLAREHCFSALVQLGSHGSSRFVLFFGTAISWNQLIDRTTSEATRGGSP